METNEMILESRRNDILSNLREGVVKVAFTKKDGTRRDMVATTKDSLIPSEHQPTSKDKATNYSKETVRCYDLEKQGWRSFRVDSLIAINEENLA